MAPKRKMDDSYSWDKDYYPEDSKRLRAVYEHQSKIHDGKNEVKNECTEESARESFQNICRRHAVSLYPHIGQQAYTVPPFLIQTRKAKTLQSGDIVPTIDVSESDVRGVQAHRKVERAFQRLNCRFEEEKKKCMFIILDYMEENYLRRLVGRKGKGGLQVHPHGDAAERNKWLGLPQKNAETETKGGRSNSDLMVVHEDKGVLFIQVKSIQDNVTTDQQTITYKIEAAAKQLKKDEENLLDRLDDNPPVTQVLALPNIRYENFENLKSKMSPHLDAKVKPLCEDSLASDDKFKEWWDKLKNNPIDPKLMEEIVGRYVGIFSSPLDLLSSNEHHHVRDLSDAILFTGRLFKRLIFTEEQRGILQKHQNRKNNVYLTGPPGSGKTLMLIQRAKMFCTSEDSRVFVLDVYRGKKGRPVGKFIYETLKNDSNVRRRIVHVELDINDENDCKKKLEQIKKSGPRETPMFVIDELFSHSKWMPIIHLLDKLGWFYWCAGVSRKFPLNSKSCVIERLTTAIRCPPTVRNVLSQVDWKETPSSSLNPAVTPDTDRGTEGPIPLCIRHYQHGSHASQQPVHCPTCAEELAKLFSNLELIPTSGEKGALPSRSVLLPCSIIILYSIPRNQYQTIRSSIYEISKTKCNDYINIVAKSRFVQTLNDRLRGKVEVRAVNSFDEDFSKNLDEIPVVWVDTFQGLERDVVVYLPGDKAWDGAERQVPRELPVPGVFPARPQRGRGTTSPSPAEEPREQTSRPSRGSRTRQSPQPSTSQQNPNEPTTQHTGLAQMMLKDSDIEKYCDWDQTNLFLAASRCCAQLIMILP